ncbi:MAG: electron transfer flavoprotein subunit alpha/FixB family protein [Oligoflexales bacterium]|nr:electron transfer flavoprotein subunit alpha/FixB family protein [Oligoflexales bacterium]
MKTLVFCEQREGKLKSNCFEALSLALKLSQGKSSEVACVLVGKELGPLTKKLEKWCGQIYTVEGADWAHYNPAHYAKALEQAVKEFQPETLLAIASPMGRDILPRLSARLSAPLLTDLVEVRGASFDGGLKPMFAGKVLAEVRFPSGGKSVLKMASLRPNLFPVEDEKSLNGSAKVLPLQVTPPADSRIKTLEIRKGKSERPDLTEAARVISGGRSLASAANFSILSDCADVLGASVGASRAAVDAGYASHEMQVGQTGKTVTPNLYIACGLSGSIQHMAGMRTSKVIVSVNTDPQAPIFSITTYGIVADLFQVVPLLTKKLKELLE